MHNPITNVTHTAVTTTRTTTRPADQPGRLRHHRRRATRTTTWALRPGRAADSPPPRATARHDQTWNTAGNIATSTKPGGLVLTYTYDDAHRLLTTTATGANVDPQNRPPHPAARVAQL